MAVPSAVLSQTLRALTNVKFGEINKQREQHASFYGDLLRELDTVPSRHERTQLLLNAVSESPGLSGEETTHEHDLSLDDIKRLLELSHYDSSVPESLLERFEQQLRSTLETKSRTFDFAHLYARLLQDWIQPSEDTIDLVGSGSPQMRETDDDFQVVERDRLQQLRERFSRVVFDPVQTDAVEIDNYLHSFFKGDDGRETLTRLRESCREKGEELWAMNEPFSVITIRRCIKGLFGQELLKDEKKTVLQEVEKSETLLSEMADVLNLRFANLQNWSWDAPRGLMVEPRRQLNGKWRVMADEDILQAIFLHFIAMHWAVHFKSVLSDLVRRPQSHPGVWAQAETVPSDYLDRREYLTGSKCPGTSLQSERNSQLAGLLLANLPSSLDESMLAYDESNNNVHLGGEASSSMKQRILRRLTADILIRKELSGHVVAAQGDLQWYAPGLPHSTILAVIKFYGIPKLWLDFFKKYLRAPLNVTMGPDGGTGDVRIRERGTPIASALAVFIGELVLFGMDLAVNCDAGLLLYRMHDDFWMSGEPRDVAKGWKAINDFVNVMGLQLNQSKSGSKYLVTSRERDLAIERSLPNGPVEMGLLKLHRETGQWEIDQDSVTAHINQLRCRLSACTSVFSWVATWNSCIGRFFSHSFGQPAAVLGRAHIDNILATHVRIQAELFGRDGTTASGYLRRVIARRFDIEADRIPDAFLFLPQTLGGLGLKNPFISLFMLRDKVAGDPTEPLRKWRQVDRDNYHRFKKAYNALSERDRRKRISRLWNAAPGTPGTLTPDTQFFSYEEWTRYQELLGYDLALAYKGLLTVPRTTKLVLKARVDVELSEEEEWVCEMHRQELEKLFGGLRIVERGLLPVGVLETMGQRPMAWSIRL